MTDRSPVRTDRSRRPRNRSGSWPRLGGRTALAALALGVAGLCVAPLASAAGPANSSTKVAAARKRCLAAVDKRTETIRLDLSRVEHATGAPSADRSTLTGQLQGVATDLTHARSAIEAADTATALRTACHDMVTSTRVYALYVPKTNALVATGRVATLRSRADAHPDRMAKVIARAETRGVPASAIADAKAKAADVAHRFTDAEHHVDGIDGRLLPLTVADVNDGSAKATVAAARDDLKAVKADVTAIRADLRAIGSDLRSK